MKWGVVWLLMAMVAIGVAAWSHIAANLRGTFEEETILENSHGGKQASGPSTKGAPGRVQGIGYVEPASEIRRLVFRIDGVIASCPVELGQHVAAGEVLMKLDDREPLAAVKVAERQARLSEVRRDQLLAGIHPDKLVAAERKEELLGERARHARVHFERIDKLQERNASSQSDRDLAATELTQSECSLEQARAELRELQQWVRPVDRAVTEAEVTLAEAHLTVARQRLADTRLCAPSDGTVLDILRREGEGARVLDAQPVMVFADDSRLRVRAEIDERHVHRLHAGQTAWVFGHGLGAARCEGRVAFVKRIMGGKTVFSRSADERKDLDVLQVLIDMPAGFSAPLGLQVDVEVLLERAVVTGSK